MSFVGIRWIWCIERPVKRRGRVLLLGFLVRGVVSELNGRFGLRLRELCLVPRFVLGGDGLD